MSNSVLITNFILDLVGVCTDVSDIEVCSNSSAQTEIAKREITLVDTSMATVSFVCILFLIVKIIYYQFVYYV